jgi:hypothetical protein
MVGSMLMGFSFSKVIVLVMNVPSCDRKIGKAKGNDEK